MGQTQNRTAVQIKDLIDTIYELVKGPAGYTGALTRLSSQASIVVPILKQRGILICTTPPKNNNPHYLWSEKAMAPNKYPLSEHNQRLPGYQIRKERKGTGKEKPRKKGRFLQFATGSAEFATGSCTRTEARKANRGNNSYK